MSLSNLLDAIEKDYRKVNDMSYYDWSNFRDSLIEAEKGGAAIDITFIPGKVVEIKVGYNSAKESTKMASVMVNEKGQILPYTVCSYAEQVEEWANEKSVGWEKLKSMGCKIAECEIKVVRYLSN